MPNTSNKLEERLKAAFRIESAERLQALAAGLEALGREAPAASRAEVVEGLFRAFHSLKGASRSVRLGNVEQACQAAENVLSALKAGAIAVSPPLLDLLQETLGFVRDCVVRTTPEQIVCLPELVDRLNAAVRVEPEAAAAAPTVVAPAAVPAPPRPAAAVPAGPVAAPPPLPASGPLAETIRVPAAKLDALLRQAEQLLILKQEAGQRCEDAQQLLEQFAAWQRAWRKFELELPEWRRAAAGPPAAAGEDLARWLTFLEWTASWIGNTERSLHRFARGFEADCRRTGANVDVLLREAKQVLMLPCSTLLGGYHLMVCDLAREFGKDVVLDVQGGSVELDKRILETMHDPLIHLVRNGVDHGIEKPAERLRRGKPARGTISIRVVPQAGNRVEIVISDDGAGADSERLVQQCLAKGELGAAEAAKLSEREKLALMFRSGISTSPIITEISGRGLGLAIVQEAVGKLNGQLAVESAAGQGTTFRIVLPITLATFRGLVVDAGGRSFVIPTLSIERAVRVGPENLRTMENREVVIVGGEALALIGLAELLELPAAAVPAAGRRFPALILTGASRRLACRVDAVREEQEILVKSLGRQLRHVPLLSGCTVLPNGHLAPILDVPDLIRAAARPGAGPGAVSGTVAAEPTAAAILLAEDSITSRMLLKNILDAAGFRVQTAIDGLDAWTTLQTQPFDLLISDVDMPRLDGFSLTARIRASERFAELPIVLVTGREKPEDRERGIEAGANAYIIKGSFNQNKLLETIRQLL